MRKFLLIATMILSCLGWSNQVSAQSAQQNTTRAGIEQLMQQLDQTIQANKGQTASNLLLNCGPVGGTCSAGGCSKRCDPGKSCCCTESSNGSCFCGSCT